jgi:sugar phosphate isomerase/epimerase
MSDTVLAAQLYTLREFCKTPADIAATLKKVRAIGYRAVQSSGLGPIAPAELRKIADGEGLAIIATHVAFEPLLNETPRLIEDHKILGCPNVAIGGMPRDNQTSAEGVAAFAKNADIVGARLRAAGLTFSYHNHSWEFEKFNGRLIMDMIYQDTKPENVMAELDTYWVQHGGGDPAAWIEKLGRRSVLLHLKDMTVVKRTPTYAEIGEGNINWDRVLKAAKAVGVQWYIVEQDTCQRDPFESLAISLRNLKAMGLK